MAAPEDELELLLEDDELELLLEDDELELLLEEDELVLLELEEELELEDDEVLPEVSPPQAPKLSSKGRIRIFFDIF